MTTAAPVTIRWHMPPDLRRRLLGPAGLPLAEWLRDGTATIVKEGPHRAVYRVRLPGLDCHVKHNRLHGLRGGIRELIRPVKARREYALAAALHRRAISTPRPLAWGVEGGGLRPCASWLVTETVADAGSLLNYLERELPQAPPAEHRRTRRRLAVALGRFLARLHAAGVVHRDFHPGNLLLRFDAAGSPSLWLLDLHTVSLGPPCHWPARLVNLSVLNRYFALRAERTDRLRCWRAYVAAADNPPPQRCVVELERMTEESNLRLWRSRDVRPLHTNRYFTRIRSAAVRGHFVRDLDRTVVNALLADPDAPFADPDVGVIKDSRSSTVAELELSDGGVVRRVIYKRFRITDRRGSWLSLVRRSAAVRSWVFGHALVDRRLPTPRPLAVWHRVRNGVPQEGYLLTEKVDGAIDLHGLVRRLESLPSATARTELLARCHALARLLRTLHQRGLSHRDLKASNILTAREGDDLRFWFIDLVGIRRHSHVSRRRKVQNLARLNASFLNYPLVSRTIRLRFLRSYLRAGLHGSGGWKDRWRAIAAATERKRAKNARNGRPLA